MKSDFLLAITQLSAEKNLPKEVVLQAVEAALVSAYKKNTPTANQEISVKINPSTGGIKVWAHKLVAEKPADPYHEVSLGEARKLKSDAQIGETVAVEVTPKDAGRIAAQTAKQVILQRLHEAEHSAIFEEYAHREGDIINGLVRRVEPKQVFVDLGRTEAVLPATEQVPSERYRVGQRLKVCLLEVAQTSRGPRVVVSRSHPNLLRRLFELEIPEVQNGTVEIKSIAREAGFRSKVAVAARQAGIDPVGCCVGLRGIRIQNIGNELSGEKIDVVQWSPERAAFIAHALSPAQVLGVRLSSDETVATVVVPDNQLSLAIGKEGQNVRLAAKLTGLRIDIKSASDAEAEARAQAPVVDAAAEEVIPEAAPVAEAPVSPPLPEFEEKVEEEAEEEAEPVAAETELISPIAMTAAPPRSTELKFAEDIMNRRPATVEAKPKKKKKSDTERKGEEGTKVKKTRRATQKVDYVETDEY
jgi:N utilization substance protein A